MNYLISWQATRLGAAWQLVTGSSAQEKTIVTLFYTFWLFHMTVVCTYYYISLKMSLKIQAPLFIQILQSETTWWMMNHYTFIRIQLQQQIPVVNMSMSFRILQSATTWWTIIRVSEYNCKAASLVQHLNSKCQQFKDSWSHWWPNPQSNINGAPQVEFLLQSKPFLSYLFTFAPFAVCS